VSDGIVGSARRLVAGTPLERPARAVASRARRVLRGAPGSPPAPVPASGREIGPESSAPMFVAAGHFYSPIPSRDDVDAYVRHWNEGFPESIPGVDLRLDAQRALLDELAPMYADADFPEDQVAGRRYWYDNHSFGHGDGLMLHLMLRHLRPQRFIEIGSGFSSCMTLDTVERWLDWGTEITMIEPYPQQLHDLLQPGDDERFTLRVEGVQSVPTDVFRTLGAGDVLFIDSTHVSRVGSDVNHEIFEVLPALQSGVYVHLHDIFYPFDYPPPWVEEGRGWTEAYVLRAFLQYNDAFEIVLWNHLLHVEEMERMARDFPAWTRNSGGSIWLRKR
jgi:hypothetical protein